MNGLSIFKIGCRRLKVSILDFDFDLIFDGKNLKVVGIVFYHVGVSDSPMTDKYRVFVFMHQLVDCR